MWCSSLITAFLPFIGNPVLPRLALVQGQLPGRREGLEVRAVLPDGFHREGFTVGGDLSKARSHGIAIDGVDAVVCGSIGLERIGENVFRVRIVSKDGNSARRVARLIRLSPVFLDEVPIQHEPRGKLARELPGRADRPGGRAGELLLRVARR